MDLEEMTLSMKGYLKDSTIRDFGYLSRLFDQTRYKFLIKRIQDRESRVLMAAAKNGELLQDVVRWATEEGKMKRTTLTERKQYLLDHGLISEEIVKAEKPSRGRPKKRLILTEENKKRFQEYFEETFA
jgi:hypothetical protein